LLIDIGVKVEKKVCLTKYYYPFSFYTHPLSKTHKKSPITNVIRLFFMVFTEGVLNQKVL
jgi:hypothetical protein